MYINGWNAAKEKTSCGSNVLHFGHFKATACCCSLAEFEASMANFPFVIGYSPTSWREAIDVELLKISNYNPETFHTIKLYHPPFNMNNMILGCKVMRHTEKYKLIAPEQFSSRRNKSTITLALNKVLG
jgi:hypothetical protein